MARRHPLPEQLDRFLRGELNLGENRSIVRHLLSGCASCARVTRGFWRRFGRGTAGRSDRLHPASYGMTWRRVLAHHAEREARWRADREGAPALYDDLLAQAPAQRLASVFAEERFASYGLALLLLEHGSKAARGPAGEATEAAELALAVAERLAPSEWGDSNLRDLAGRGWTLLAAGRRRAGDLAGAERALEAAEALLRLGSGDPLERAAMLREKALLHEAEGLSERAGEILQRAAGIYRRAHDNHHLARVLVEAARIQATRGDADAAISLLRRGLPKLDRERKPAWLLASLRQLIRLLLETGRTGEALLWLQQAEPLARTDRSEWLQLLRLRGRAALAAGRAEEAESALREARAGLHAAGLGRDAILAALDLARLYTLQRRSRGEPLPSRATAAKLRLLGQEMSSWTAAGLDLDTSAALFLFRSAAEEDRLTESLVTQLAGYLERAWERTAGNPAPESPETPDGR